MAISRIKTRAIDATATSNNLNIDAGTLYLDATNNRVGVANTSPTVALDVTGAAKTSLDATINGVTVGKGAGTVASNTVLGAGALAANTTAIRNTAIGNTASASGTTGQLNTAVGYQALNQNTTGSSNTAVGDSAGRYYTGNNAVIVGQGAVASSGGGTDITAVGAGALNANTTGAYSTAIGSNALANNTTASNNTAVGYQAGYTNSTGLHNTFVGYQAGYSSTGGENTCVGRTAGYSISTGTGNTFVGPGNGATSNGSGYYVTTGSLNTIIGGYNGNQGGLDIRTASNYIVLSDGVGNPRAHNNGGSTWSFSGAGNGATTANFYNNGNSTPYGLYVQFSAAAPNNTGQYFLACIDTGGERTTVRANGGIANYSGNNVNLSDRREKTNFEPSKSYLNTICSIPVQTFNYIDQNLEEDDGLTLGVVAQDVQAVAPELVMESNWGTEEKPKMRLSIYQTDLQYALMKSIQELKALVDAQATDAANLKAEFDEYKRTHP